MARKPLIRSSCAAYHVTSRCNNREWFELPMDVVWDVFIDYLSLVSDRYRAEIHTFCLMSNHYHLVLSTPDENLDEIMRDLMTGISKRLARKSARINHVFGGRYKWSILYDCWAFAFVYKYVCRNPVRAKICEKVEDYRYSTLRGLIDGNYSLPVVEGLSPLWKELKLPIRERVIWLNEPTPKELEDLIGKALRRFEFKFSPSNNNIEQLLQLRESYKIGFDDRYLFF